MERPTCHRLVLAALSMALTGSSVSLAQSPTPMTDADAEAIYAALLPYATPVQPTALRQIGSGMKG